MMDASRQTSISDNITAAMDWWRDAGVDSDFCDEPLRWLAENGPISQIDKPEPGSAITPQMVPEAPIAAIIGGPRDGWPQELAGFAPWWLSEPSLDHGQTSGRVAPRGGAGAELMVLVAEPESDDGEILLSGQHGALLDAILAALGIAADAAYVASALPRHTPMADWPALQASGLGEVLLHHIALAAPRRLIIFGGNVLSLLGNDLAKNTEFLPGINHVSPNIPLMSAMELASLIAKPRIKARLWQRLLEWTA